MATYDSTSYLPQGWLLQSARIRCISRTIAWPRTLAGFPGLPKMLAGCRSHPFAQPSPLVATPDGRTTDSVYQMRGRRPKFKAIRQGRRTLRPCVVGRREFNTEFTATGSPNRKEDPWDFRNPRDLHPAPEGLPKSMIAPAADPTSQPY